MDKLTYLLLAFIVLTISSCASSMKPFHSERVIPGLESKVNASLKELPKPEDKIVAAVYRFTDQTGQYKSAEQVASWSTAVTQGATSILIRAMENSGWFTPIEREGLSNLLNERKIITSTRSQNGSENRLPPLLFAGVILEGGIIGYDTNIMTGGVGVRYLGTGASGEFRKDQVTIYLRAVSTQTGRVLKTVHTTKSIISQQLDGGLFRFVDTNRLLETEAGYTYNEPPVMAVTEAIDEALKNLIIEGVSDGLWDPADPNAFAGYEQQYFQQKKQVQEQRDYYGLKRNQELRSGFIFSGNISYGSHIGSYGMETENPGAIIRLETFLSPCFSFSLNGLRSEIGAEGIFSAPFSSADLLLNTYLTPELNLSPYVGIGGGVIAYDRDQAFTDWQQFYPTATGEAGLDYKFNNWLGWKIGINYRYLLKDGIDGVSRGTVHDQQWNVFTGFTLSP